MRKAISLSAEMAESRNAFEGARFLADELATGGMEDRRRELQAPLTISAILVLVELRLHQVERVLRGEEDPLLLWAPHNDVSPIQAEDEEHDLVLRSWSEPGEDEEPSTRRKASQSPVQGTPRRTGSPPEPSPDQPPSPGMEGCRTRVRHSGSVLFLSSRTGSGSTPREASIAKLVTSGSAPSAMNWRSQVFDSQPQANFLVVLRRPTKTIASETPNSEGRTETNAGTSA